jgi:putative transposase
MRALSAQYPRYDYRRIRIFLGRDGHAMRRGRAYLLWWLALGTPSSSARP